MNERNARTTQVAETDDALARFEVVVTEAVRRGIENRILKYLHLRATDQDSAFVNYAEALVQQRVAEREFINAMTDAAAALQPQQPVKEQTHE
jgi:hypothetical protein